MSITWQIEYNSADASIPLESRTYQNKRLPLRQVLYLQVYTAHWVLATVLCWNRTLCFQHWFFHFQILKLIDAHGDGVVTPQDLDELPRGVWRKVQSYTEPEIVYSNSYWSEYAYLDYYDVLWVIRRAVFYRLIELIVYTPYLTIS